MFPKPRKLHNPLRLISVTNIGKRGRHLLRLDKEMRRRDIVVLAIQSVGNLLQGSFAIKWVRPAIDGCVTDGFMGADCLLAVPEAESQKAELGEGEKVHYYSS